MVKVECSPNHGPFAKSLNISQRSIAGKKFPTVHEKVIVVELLFTLNVNYLQQSKNIYNPRSQPWNGCILVT